MEGVIHIVTGIDCHSGREYCQWKGTIHNNIVIGRTCYSGGEHCQWNRTVVICLRVLWSTQNEREHCHCNTVQENKDNPKHTQMHILPTILYWVETWHSSLDYRNIKNSILYACKKHQTSAVSLAESGE